MPRLLLRLLPLALALAWPPGAAAQGGLLRPVPLVAGQPATLATADLIASDAALAFEGTPEVAAAHDPDVGTLVLTPRADFEGLTLVPFTADGAPQALPVRVRVLVNHTFRLQPAGEASRVHVIGQFNDWDRGRDALAPGPDGTWTLTLPLDPGRYEYKFTVDGEEVLDPANDALVPNGFGDFNNVLVVPPRHGGGGGAARRGLQREGGGGGGAVRLRAGGGS